MNTTNALLFLHAQTALHPGTGAALGTVDLPIQRERHTGWPNIAGSSLKGVLRDNCRPPDDSSDEYQHWLAVFGPETNEADAHAGALSLTDARILAFPVRSLKGVFAWVTCPAVLERLHRDAQLAETAMWGELPACPAENQALVADDSDLLVTDGDGKRLLLEEFDFTRTGDGAAVKKIADWLAENAVADDFTRSRLQSHLVVLHDNDFSHFVRHATEVTARIGLDYETKTVKSGALFYQEFLPAETLMYALVLPQDSRRRFSKDEENDRRKNVPWDAKHVLAFVSQSLTERNVLQIGGDETTGKGLCRVRLQPTTATTTSEATK